MSFYNIKFKFFNDIKEDYRDVLLTNNYSINLLLFPNVERFRLDNLDIELPLWRLIKLYETNL